MTISRLLGRFSLRQFRLFTTNGINPPASGSGSGSGSTVIHQQDFTLSRAKVPQVFPRVFALPVARKPLFPLSMKNLVIRDAAVYEHVEELLKKGTPYVGAFLTKDDDNERDVVKSLDEIHRVGTFCQILRAEKSQEGLTVLLMPHRRIRATELFEVGKVTEAMTENLSDEKHTKRNPVIKALTSEILSVMKELVRINPQLRDQIALYGFMSGVNLVEEPAQLADFTASLVPFAESKELQSILSSLVIEERLQKSLILLKKELINAKLQAQIDRDVEEKMNKARKDYYLMESMKGIQKELGLQTDGKEKLVELFQKRAIEKKMPENVMKVFEEELNKFRQLEPSAVEYASSRGYLDWLTIMPWGVTTKDTFDLKQAREILDSEHYGMQDVKNRILEFIAVSKLKGSVQGKILCLSGPPGVGKTSIGKSIAKTLGREFYRFSVGGLSDVTEIKGHRRTYVGAMPGKLIQALKRTQTENPLILIDEIDKLGRSSFRGDPSSALLEVLDPEQNNNFLDHYMDVPVDLSKVLFMCTANVLDTIPGPLLDRMEVIQLSGYIAEEKREIAKSYLVPSVLKSCGLKAEQVNLQSEALDTLISDYCRESGVRSLKKQIEKVYRKAALKLVRNSEESSVTVSNHNLKKYAGNPIFSSELMYDKPPVGVSVGLAWTGLGGTVLFIESISVAENQDKASFIKTGQMGDVMKESTRIALTFAKSFMAEHFPENDFFRKTSIHLHVPEGAIPKDGPSAGATMVSSLLSLALQKEMKPKTAMTGEISLIGKILRIGGVKEKVIAAKRAGVETIILPQSNKSDYEQLPDFVKQGISANFVSDYSEVFKLIFPGVQLLDS
ncbi:hypothetical protein MP638_003127 [Amoeboaphelidium occidentale]|nr:hypothetical protein MP638_003127 [Amoeboaphelidium occidentale]